MVIDMHVHPIFYEGICGDPEELEFRKNTFGVWKQSPMTDEELFTVMDVGGIDRTALLALDLTTTAGGWVVTNEEVAGLRAAHPDRFYAFGSVDPHRPDALDAARHALCELKLDGLKLNTAKQKFMPCDPAAEPIYELCEKENKPIIFHAGMSWEPDTPSRYCHPLAFEDIFIRHPQLRCCLAHFAWPWVREMAMLMIKYPNVYTDTSVLYLDSPEESISRLFTQDMGPMWFERGFRNQVMFGSNNPRFRAFKIKRALDAVPMRGDARENLYSGNALRFLKGGD